MTSVIVCGCQDLTSEMSWQSCSTRMFRLPETLSLELPFQSLSLLDSLSRQLDAGGYHVFPFYVVLSFFQCIFGYIHERDTDFSLL